MRISPRPPRTPQAPAPDADLRAAGTAFEAMMLQQLLQSAMPKPEGATGDWHAIALDALSRDLATHQPFGLARLLETPK